MKGRNLTTTSIILAKRKMMGLYIAVVGGRDVNNYELLKNTLNKFIENKSFLESIISADDTQTGTLVEKYAKELNVEHLFVKSNFDKFRSLAQQHRNTEMIEKSDIVFAFWDGKSPGTSDSINKAKELNKQLFIINY